MKILLVEDDSQIARALSLALTDAMYAVDCVDSAKSARMAAVACSYQVVLLDLGLPDANGLDLLRDLRSSSNATIIIVSANDDIINRIGSIDAGADDYLVKPFHTAELLARIRAVRRRCASPPTQSVGNGSVRLDAQSYRLTFEGQSEFVSAREYALLSALLERPGAILSRQQLEQRLYNSSVASNAVDVVIYGIRQKFGARIVRNVRGLGWMVSNSASDQSAGSTSVNNSEP
jgi:two-component system OmpR family response regulator